MTKEILHAAFLPFGDIIEVQLPRDERSTVHRGFGYVEFDDAADAAAAIENMDQAMLAGRVLNVMQAKPQKEGTVLGSKVAVWAQVSCRPRVVEGGGLISDTNEGLGMNRRAGWRNMRSVRRTVWQRRRQKQRP